MNDASQVRPISLQNAKNNTHWGDQLGEKPTNVTRVYSLNANGLSLDARGGRFDNLCNVAKEVQADILCCQEHNLDTTRTNVRSILYETARQHWSRFRLKFGTTPIPFHTNYKPGGTMIISMGDTTGRVIQQHHDKWGRWCTQILRASGSVNVALISAYQVVTDNPHIGLTTATAQQQSLLVQTNDCLRSPRKSFKRDLRITLLEHLSAGDEIILVGDFNEAFGSEIDGMSQIAAELHLINLMQTRHPQELPATYSRGRKCLDYGLATRRAAMALTACGYEAFHQRFSTDHRAYYFDFDTDILFGNLTQVLAPHSQRSLKSNNAEQVTQYIQLKYEYLESRDAFRRSRTLSSPGNRHAFAERLDSDVLKASLDAEQNTKRFRTPAWSMALHEARTKLSVLRKCLSMFRTGLDVSSIIQTETETAGITMELPRNRQQCNVMIRAVQTEIQTIVNESFQRRDQERNDRISQLEQSSSLTDKNHATMLRRLKRAEKVKQLFEKLKSARARGQQQGVTRLEIPLHPDDDPKSCTDWQTIDVPSDIVTQLQRRNRQHFGQAQGTPFTVDPLAGGLGFCGASDIADSILIGDYPTTEYSEAVRLLLQHLKLTQEMANVQSTSTVSIKEFQGKVQAWRESTTTSPSGLHLGHYKALFAKHKYSHYSPKDLPLNPTDIELAEHNRKMSLKAEFDYMQQSIASLHLDLLNYALERGYSYRRWQCIANTILFKDPGSVKIHRTRVIHIYEADFNLMLGLKWRAALYQAELLKQLNEGQFGSRPRKNAVDPVMIEELQLEISRLSRRMLIQTNYDATACYDRIIPNLAVLASRRFGVEKTVTQSNALTLLEARYHIRTELGLSEASYTHSHEYPIYGTGQGSGNSPMIWCFVSSLLYDCYESTAHNAWYCNPDRSNECSVYMVGFVDDSNGQVNCFGQPDTATTLQELVSKATFNATQWSELLQATGGALELSKCSYHVLFWKFSVQGAPVLSNIKSEISPMYVVDPASQDIQLLEYLPPTVAHKTLGYYKEPTGSQKTQYRQLKAKSDHITEFLWKTHLTREEAWTYYHACYLPAITYPLTGSFLSPTQLHSIETKAMAIIVAKCGFNRNTKKAVLYGPHELGGAEFSQLAVQQGIAQIQYFLKHWRSRSYVGRLLKCAVAWMQFSAGMSYSLLERVEVPLPHIESKWLSSLRSFLATIDASLQLDDPCLPPLQREKDQYLMDLIIQSGRFKPVEVRKLNYCRLFLQAVTLADITKPNGRDLDVCFLTGSRSLFSGTTRWHTVNQDKPSLAEWKLWRQANALWSDSQGTLTQPLGAWLQPLKDMRFQYFAYTSGRSLYVLNESRTFSVFRQQPQARYCPSSSTRTKTYAELPPRARPAEVELDAQNNWILIGNPFPSIRPLLIPPSATATFELFVETLDPWETELLRHVTTAVDPFSLCVTLSSGFRAVSDGSVKELGRHGSFGWVLSSPEGDRLAVGMGPARGAKLNSYRAEAYGLLSILRFLYRVREYTAMHEPWKGVVATDSQGVLDTLQLGDVDPQADETPLDLDRGRVVLDCLRPEWDLLIEIQSVLTLMPGVSLQYVPGHQDKKQPYHSLDLLGQLNVDADKKAGEFNFEFGAHRPYALLTPLTRAHLLISEGTVTGRYKRVISYEATHKPLLEYIKGKNEWNDSILHSVNWEAHGAALKHSSVPHTHLVKLLHKILPTHAHSNKLDGGNRRCPLCGSLKEDHLHIVRCEHPTRALWRTNFLIALHDFLHQSNASSIMREFLLTAMGMWFQSPNQTTFQIDPTSYHPTLRRAISQQNRIGWHQLLFGRFAVAWQSIQRNYLEYSSSSVTESKSPSAAWQASLIRFVWERWYTLWKQRNQEVHGFDAQTKAAATQREIRRQLDDIYRNRTMYEHHVQALLHRDVVEHEHHPIHVNQNWLSINSNLFRESYRRVQRNAQSGMRSLRNYFAVS